MVLCGFPQHALGPQLDLAQRLGASHVEFYPRWSADPDPLSAAREVRDRGLNVWSTHGPWGSETWGRNRVDLGSPDRSLREASVVDVRRAIAWIAAARGEHLVVHPGVLSVAGEFDDRRRALRDSLAALAPDAARQRVFVCVENMPRGCFPGSRVADNAALVSELADPHVALCVDTGHAHIAGDIAGELREAAQLLRTTHVHDNDGRKDEHLPPGLGTIPWVDFSRTLGAIGYDGVMMLECPRYLREHPEVVTAEWIERLGQIRRRPPRHAGAPE
jgi:sugar phosphate isomerase/epimerase